ncbi:MAG: sugar ABC transporter permease [Clostridia bacterium]|nr:sugar ABC transporter permease [Clostridia bacterium]
MVFYYAVTSGAVNGEFVGLDNFKALFENNAFTLAAVNTLILLVIAVPAAVLLSLFLAILLERELPGKSFLRSAFLSPLMVPVASVVLIWQVLFHQNGVVNTFLSGFGIASVDWFHSSWSRFVVLLLYLWKNLGYNMILFTAAIASVPREQLEIAELEGAGPFRKFFSVKILYISSTVLFVTVLSLISAMKIFREVYLLTGAYPYETLYLLQHFMNNTFRSMDYQKLSTAAIVLALIMSVVIAVLFVVERRLGKDAKNE